MSGKGRRAKLPRFVPSGRENRAPKPNVVVEPKEKGLKECAQEVAEVLTERIRQSQQKIDEMMTEIARLQNNVQKKKMGFKSKVMCKKEEIASKHRQLIEQIQSTTSVQLAENEKLAAQITSLTEELEKLAKPVEVVIPEVAKVDLSAKTNRLLKEREEEMRRKCSEEFKPFFEKLESEHLQNIASLQRIHEVELRQIDDQCQAVIDAFQPTALISKEELRMQNRYEIIMQKERKEFERKRDELAAKIKVVESERDREMQRITDETDEEIFQGEQLLQQKIQEIRGLVVEPPVEELSLDITISKEQEKEIREKIDQDLKDGFERNLKQSVDEVAQRRDRMEKEMVKFCEAKAVEAEEESQNMIERTKAEIEGLLHDIRDARDELNSMKAEWADMNQTRRDREDMLKVLKERNEVDQKRLDEVRKQLKILQEVKEEDNHEADEIQADIDRLGEAVIAEKRRHIGYMKKKKAEHESSLEQIKERVETLKQAKDELIEKLKMQVRDTRRKGKTVQQDLQARMGKYQRQP